jgi:flavin-dependent dehydrogenase
VKDSPPTDAAYDVVIIGGSLSGASAAFCLLQEQPALRVLIVEKSARFTRRVGEATVEISAYFLSRVLGLMRHLNESHLVKQGFRFWFADGRTGNLGESSEIGARYLARVPAFQVDRSVLDEEVLRRAQAQGAHLWRPATVQAVELTAGGLQKVTIREGGLTRWVAARWVVDASGVAAFLARQQGWWRANEDHPTSAVWSRWRGVKDLDGLELARRYPEWARASYGIRTTATNHLMGDGWWAWMIPLKNGDVSVGVVFDRRFVDWPEEGSLGQRLKDFLCAHPVGRELLSEASWVEGDVHWRGHLPFYTTTHAGDGFVLVGDAAGFLDPFYSPGMDWIAFTVTAGVEMILAQQRGEDAARLVARHNADFSRAYQRWFEAVYRDKYDYLGDFELCRLAFLLDLGFYYLGVVSQPFKRGAKALCEPLFSTAPSVPVYHLMRTYHRRFVRMAQSRRARGVWGRCNHGNRFLFGGYTFAPVSSWPLLRAMWEWGWLEVKEGWRTWFRRASAPTRTRPAQAALPAPAASRPLH